MAITCNFYSFSKKENSTARPSGSGTSYSCTLKEPTSIEAPTLELAIASPTFYDYAYIPSFDRYYYVTDWTYNRGVWEVTLAVDVLASFKTEIGASSIYVLRASADYDPEIKDMLYPLKSELTKQVEQGTLYQWATSFLQGTYIAYINNGQFDPNSAYGSLNFMTFTPAQFTYLLTALYPRSPTTWEQLNFTNAYNMLASAILNPVDYITKVVWIPLPLPAGNIPTAFGYYVAQYIDDDGETQYVKHGVLSSFKQTQTVTLTIPKRADNIRGAWADSEPFGKYYVYYAPFGVIPLDSLMMAKGTSLQAVATLDCMTGELRLTLSTIGDYGSYKDIVFDGIAKIGIEIPIDKAKSDSTRVIQAGGGTIMSGIDVALGNYVGLAKDLGDTVGTVLAPPPKGSNVTASGLLGIADTIYLYHEYYDFVDSDNTNKGRPLCAIRQVSNLGGYMLTNNGNISISGTAEEKAAVRRYLEGGFYYE